MLKNRTDTLANNRKAGAACVYSLRAMDALAAAQA